MDLERFLDKNMKKKKLYVNRPAVSRDDVVGDAINGCLDKMYGMSYPPITLDELRDEAKKLGPEERDEARLFERHYLPAKMHTLILEDYAEAYQLKSELPDIIQVLKEYFKRPIVDKWIEGVNKYDPGHRGYDRPEPMPEEHRVVAEKYMDMANDFFHWNRDLNAFYFNVCNVSPCSNRETVEKWYHEHGDPDFKIPEDDYWVYGWDDEECDENEEDDEE